MSDNIILIKNALIINENKKIKANLLIKNDLIFDIIEDNKLIPEDNYKVIDADGLILIPGVIDDQVHFREPGLTHKADIYTEAKAAIAGGVTSFMEMPNTNPQTITQSLLEDKFQIAEQKSLANFSFYIGATNDNIKELLKTDIKNVCGIKIFMGSSTGNMLVNDEKILSQIFAESPLLIATHCEDDYIIKTNLQKYTEIYVEDIPVKFHHEIRNTEACYKSSQLAVRLANKYNTRLHLLHLSTEKELSLLDNKTNLKDKKITAEVCVHHLWFDNSDYEIYGNLIKWNPAIKTIDDKIALLNGLLNNKLDVIATDHAPHTKQEKNNSYLKAPSGAPFVQHSLCKMLELYHQQKISIEKIVEKMCHAPADIFKIKKRGYIRKGYFADLVLIDLNNPWIVSPENILYKCGWSPIEGQKLRSKVVYTIVNGNLVYNKGVFSEDKKGKRLEFER